VPTFSTKAFWELTAAMEEDDLGCAAAACLTASAGRHQHSQHTAPAAQQQVLQQQQPAVQRPQLKQQQQQQQVLLSSPSLQPKYAALKDTSGFRRLQTTPGTAMFSTVLNSMPDDDDTDEEVTEGYSDDDLDQPAAGPGSSPRGFAAVLQQELQGQLGATAASREGGPAGTFGVPKDVPAAEAAASPGHSNSLVLGSSRSSRQHTSPTTAALAPTAAATSGVVFFNQHGLAGDALVSSAAAGGEASTVAHAAVEPAISSPGSAAAPAEGDAEQFLVACLQPGVVQALAVLVHADILPLCSEDGSGTAHCMLCAFELDCPASPDDTHQAVCTLL
jgi:hypothetical protein